MQMSYKGHAWPMAPENLTVSRKRALKDLAQPFWGGVLQDLGTLRRQVAGKGVFIGPQAAAEFHHLEELFAQRGPGELSLPGHAPSQAVFATLELLDSSRPNTVEYAFSFVEEDVPTQSSPMAEEYICGQGETLWTVAAKTGTTVEALLACNPVRRPTALEPGQRLVLP